VVPEIGKERAIVMRTLTLKACSVTAKEFFREARIHSIVTKRQQT
jgi:hypothetical protein